MKKQNVKKIILMLMIINVMFWNNGYGAIYIWTGIGGNELWSNPANWLEGSVPGPTDDVLFDWNALNDCTLDITTSIQNLTVNNFDYLLTIPSGYNISIAGDIFIGVRLQTWINTSNIILNGSGNQTIKIEDSGLWTFENLTINKSSTDTVFLGSAIYANGTFSNYHGTAIVSDPLSAGYSISYGALPIELLSFDLFAGNDDIKIIWSTASETNNDYFIIERSRDYISWIRIGEIVGNGNSNIIINYSTTDYHPLSGISYYRLTQVDYDGKHEIFPPKSIFFLGRTDMQIYPNPATTWIYFPTDCIIFNQWGAQVMSGIAGIANIEYLAHGIYYIKIQNKTYPFIKQ